MKPVLHDWQNCNQPDAWRQAHVFIHPRKTWHSRLAAWWNRRKNR